MCKVIMAILSLWGICATKEKYAVVPSESMVLLTVLPCSSQFAVLTILAVFENSRKELKGKYGVWLRRVMRSGS